MAKGTTEICNVCDARIILKTVGEDLLSFNPDGTLHRCRLESETKPIGPAITGRIIESFSLRKGRVTLVLSDNIVLEISSSLDDERVAMNLRLVSPEGIFEENR